MAKLGIDTVDLKKRLDRMRALKGTFPEVRRTLPAGRYLEVFDHFVGLVDAFLELGDDAIYQKTADDAAIAELRAELRSQATASQAKIAQLWAMIANGEGPSP